MHWRNYMALVRGEPKDSLICEVCEKEKGPLRFREMPICHSCLGFTKAALEGFKAIFDDRSDKPPKKETP